MVMAQDIIEMSSEDRLKALNDMSDEQLKFTLQSLMHGNQQVRIASRLDALTIYALRTKP
jgi:hypothetical protein